MKSQVSRVDSDIVVADVAPEDMPGEDVDYTPFAADPAFDAADGYSEEDQDLTFAEEATKKNLMREYADYIFGKTDMDGDGVLNFQEYASLIYSATLSLGLRDEQAYGMYQKAADLESGCVNSDGFVGVMESIIKHYASARRREGARDWMWFGMYFDDEPESLPVYINGTDMKLTYDKPSCFVSRVQDTESFEQILLADGSVHTTRFDDTGQRLYLDYETGEWRTFPDEWCQDIVSSGDGSLHDHHGGWEVTGEQQDETFTHPGTGVTHQALWDGTQRLLFDEENGVWIPMPVALEVFVPKVTRALAKLEEEMPEWTDAYQRVLALRTNGYDVDATLAWKANEARFGGGAGLASNGVVSFDATSALASTAGGPSQASRAELHQLQERLQQVQRDAEAAIEEASLKDRRIKDLETAASAGVSQAEADEQQAKIARLSEELEHLKAGGEMKETLAKTEGLLEVAKTEYAGMKTRMSGVGSSAGRLLFAVQSLRAEQARLRATMREDLFDGFLGYMKEAAATLAARAGSAVEAATRELVAKYRFEVRQRKLIYNKLQELKGNIRVFCRVRYDSRVKCALAFPDADGMGEGTEIVCPDANDGKVRRKFEFDRVYTPENSQEDVFEDTEAIMTSCVDGYNVCLIAYGQTGSGKTYTMMGTDDNPGVNRRAVKQVLQLCRARDDTDFVIKVSLLEIYNEKILDLLSDQPASEQKCDVRIDPKTKLSFVSNLSQHEVTTEQEVLDILARGDANRSVAATKMNSTSSRSHCLLQIAVHSQDKISGQKACGTLSLVDLAGSERISKTEASGQRLVEAAAINKSLTALGQVFAGLRTGQSHIPYRNSKLTHLLQDSLGGDAKTCVFVNVSPADSNLSETTGTLKFGQAIRTIELGPMGKNANAKKAGQRKK